MTMTPETAQALGWLVGACRAARVPLGDDVCTARRNVERVKNLDDDQGAIEDAQENRDATENLYRTIRALEKQIDESLDAEAF